MEFNLENATLEKVRMAMGCTRTKNELSQVAGPSLVE
jgi:hypothetical protein